MEVHPPFGVVLLFLLSFFVVRMGNHHFTLLIQKNLWFKTHATWLRIDNDTSPVLERLTSSPMIIRLRREVHILLLPPSCSHVTGDTSEGKGRPRFPKLTMFQLYQKLEETDKQTHKDSPIPLLRTLSKGGTKPPFDLLFTKQRGTQMKRRNTPIPKKAHKCSNCDKNQRIQTSKLNSKGNAAHVLSSFIFSHHFPLLNCHSPSTLRKAFVAVTVPQENFMGTVITVKEESPATLSSPNTHPSFLGREGPLLCGSPTPHAQAPNPRGRALPVHSTNPAQ